MYLIVSCKKYARRNVRVFDIGDKDPSIIATIGPMECVVCGPCSHVELGAWSCLWDVHALTANADDAVSAMRELVANDGDRYRFP